MAGSRPLVGPICQDDIDLIAGCWSWMENDTHFFPLFGQISIMQEFGL
jgi:hypothetical protein